jgi:hypothetical protein
MHQHRLAPWRPRKSAVRITCFPKKNGSRPVMLTATEYRAEFQWCVELASKLLRQDREVSNALMVLGQRYNWAARQAEEREIRALHHTRTCRVRARWQTMDGPSERTGKSSGR